MPFPLLNELDFLQSLYDSRQFRRQFFPPMNEMPLFVSVSKTAMQCDLSPPFFPTINNVRPVLNASLSKAIPPDGYTILIYLKCSRFPSESQTLSPNISNHYFCWIKNKR